MLRREETVCAGKRGYRKEMRRGARKRLLEGFVW